MKEMLVWLAVQIAPQDVLPPAKCDLLNSVKGGTSNLVGNVIALQDLAPWIAGVLIVFAVLVAAIPKLRRMVLGHLGWVLGIMLVSGVIAAGILVFYTPQCA